MQWIEVSVPTHSDEIDDVCAQLAELGAGGMVVEDEADFQDFLEHNHQYWDYVDDALEAQFRGVRHRGQAADRICAGAACGHPRRPRPRADDRDRARQRLGK